MNLVGPAFGSEELGTQREGAETQRRNQIRVGICFLVCLPCPSPGLSS
jgi:hypothetical protein